MANNSRSLKPKHKLEPISIDELAGDSTMTGFSDIFKIPTIPASQSHTPAASNSKHPIDIVKGKQPADAVPLETGGLVSAGPVLPKDAGWLQGSVSTQEKTTTEASQAEITQPDTDPLDTDPPDTAPPDTAPPVLSTLQRTLKIREAKLVQEGHTYGEQTVYEALWKNGIVVSDSFRLITIGFLKMASIAGMAESNCKAAVAGLLEKLAIERLHDKNISQGRTYKVYGWADVLARRRASGLTHIIKTRGVVFVDSQTGRRLTASKTLPRRPSQRGSETGGTETGGGETSGPDTSGPVSNLAAKTREITDLASRLRNDLDPAFDDRAAGRLLRECQNSVPDCTIDEIMHFVVLKAQKIYKDRNIRNQIGLLLMTIPEFFTGSAVHELRDRQSREDEQRRTTQQQQRNYWQEVANDRNTSSEERQLALKFLAEMD
jgi:hypothetical protein